MNVSRLLSMALLSLLLTLVLPGPVARGQQDPSTYTIQPGDTLSSIAQRFHVPMDLLIQVNDLADPDLIQVGQTLVIPSMEDVARARQAERARAALRELRPALLAASFRFPDALTAALGPHDLYIAARFGPMLRLRQAGLPSPLLQVDAPERLVQGRTGVVRVVVAAPLPPTGRFQDRPLTFIGEGADVLGYHYAALMPTGALDKPGEKPLRLQLGDVVWEQPVSILAGDYITQHIVLPPSKGGLLAPDKLKEERERLYALWSQVSGPPRWREPFRFPIAEGFPRTSPYGTRRSYNGGPVSSFHAGSDWGAPEGTPILAPAPGVVVLAETLFVRGGAVIIDHGAGVYSNFWHLSRIDVQPGDEVAAGDALGLVGNTGLSTGAHLHWEVRVNSVAVDPMQWTERALLEGD